MNELYYSVNKHIAECDCHCNIIALVLVLRLSIENRSVYIMVLYLINIEVYFRRGLEFSFKRVCSFSPHKIPLFMLTDKATRVNIKNKAETKAIMNAISSDH